VSGTDERAELSASEVRRRAAAGAVVVGARGAAVRVVALAGTVVLARMLTPSDFGVVALGTVVIALGGFLGEAGLGAALIRGRRVPVREDLRAMMGLQVVGTVALAAAVAVVAAPMGRDGAVIAVMAAALPFTALKTPGTVMLERSLDYRTVAAVEVLETVAYYGWAVAAAAAGAGVWALATAAILRVLVGGVTMVRLGPVGLVAPGFSRARWRELVGFGARFQAVALAGAVRDQGLNAGTAAIAGVGTLGIWTVANRLLQAPFLLLESLWRVSYPAMARLIELGEDARPVIERAVSLVATGTAWMLAVLVGATPALVPVVLGARWDAAVEVMPWAALGLAIGGPVSVAAAGYLFAVGEAGIVLRGIVLHSLAWMAVGFGLLPVVGVAALGIGWLAASLVETAVLGRAAAARTGAEVLTPLFVPVLAGTGAATAGWLAARAGGDTLASAALGATLPAGLYFVVLWLGGRRALSDTVALAGRAVRLSVARAR
jgi:polysaccharide transporter, PST family